MDDSADVARAGGAAVMAIAAVAAIVVTMRRGARLEKDTEGLV